MTTRRALLGTAAALSGAAAQAATATAAGKTAVGTYSILRNRYGRKNDFVFNVIIAPVHVPWESVQFQEGKFCRLSADGTLQIREQGLYRVCLGFDWKAQDGTDIDTRMYGIRRKLASDLSPPALTDERLASYDVPGSDSPCQGRFTGTWTPGLVPYGGHVFVDVTVSPANGSIKLGDVAHASLSSAAEGVIGLEASLGLQLRAQVVGTNTVRVIASNAFAPSGIVVPTGTLRVLAQSTTEYRGDSEDAWNVLITPLTELFPGDRLYAVGKNQGMLNDYIQPSINSTFMQVEKYG